MGLAGNMPDTVDIDAIPAFIRDVETRGRLLLANGQHEVDFPQDDGMRFRSDNLSLHENGMQIHAFSGDKVVFSCPVLEPTTVSRWLLIASAATRSRPTVAIAQAITSREASSKSPADCSTQPSRGVWIVSARENDATT
jgi:hypothetical protein